MGKRRIPQYGRKSSLPASIGMSVHHFILADYGVGVVGRVSAAEYEMRVRSARVYVVAALVVLVAAESAAGYRCLQLHPRTPARNVDCGSAARGGIVQERAVRYGRRAVVQIQRAAETVVVAVLESHAPEHERRALSVYVVLPLPVYRDERGTHRTVNLKIRRSSFAMFKFTL